jgi:hypothetical protein
VTDEGEAETVKWVEEKGAKYAYGYDRGGKLASYFKVSGIPAAVLVDAKGIVVWQGHPSGVTDALIEKAVAGALAKELAGLPERDAVEALLAELDANKEAAAVIKAQKQVAKLRASELSKRKELEAAMADLAKISKANSGNFAGKQAEEFLNELKERARAGR